MCLHTSIFIKTPSLEGLPTKAKEDPSHNEMRLSPTGHQPSISWSQRLIYLLRIFCEKRYQAIGDQKGNYKTKENCKTLLLLLSLLLLLLLLLLLFGSFI